MCSNNNKNHEITFKESKNKKKGEKGGLQTSAKQSKSRETRRKEAVRDFRFTDFPV
jgi:hypothetical protein